MHTEFMLLAIYNKPRLNLKEVCEAIGMSMKTAYNQRSANTFPIMMSGDPLHADIRDVAAYLDRLRISGRTRLRAQFPGQQCENDQIRGCSLLCWTEFPYSLGKKAAHRLLASIYAVRPCPAKLVRHPSSYHEK